MSSSPVEEQKAAAEQSPAAAATVEQKDDPQGMDMKLVDIEVDDDGSEYQDEGEEDVDDDGEYEPEEKLDDMQITFCALKPSSESEALYDEYNNQVKNKNSATTDSPTGTTQTEQDDDQAPVITDLQVRRIVDIDSSDDDDESDYEYEGQEDIEDDGDYEDEESITAGATTTEEAAANVIHELVELFVQKNGRAPTDEEVRQWIDVFQSLSVNEGQEQEQVEPPVAPAAME